MSRGHQPVDAVIFDWGGTLTPWHEVDLPQQWRVYAREVHGLPLDTTQMPPEDLAEADSLALRIHAAEEQAWKRSAELSQEVFASPDSVEGARAFAEKRPPVWKTT